MLELQKKSRTSWGSFCRLRRPTRASDAGRGITRSRRWHSSGVPRSGPPARHPLPPARRCEPCGSACPAAYAGPRAHAFRKGRRVERVTRRALRGQGAGRGLRDVARCKPIPVLGADDVPHSRWGIGGPGAPQPTAPPGVHQAGADRDRPQSGLVVGHHETEGPREVDVLLPLRDDGHLQPVRRGLDGRVARVRQLGRASAGGVVREARHRARPAHAPCRPWTVDDPGRNFPVAIGR